MPDIAEIDPQKKYSVTEAAPLLEVDESTVRRLARNGLFPGAERKSPVPGSPFVFPGVALIAFLENRKLKKK